MSRVSSDEFTEDGRLINGFDYDLQVWVRHGIIEDCGHPEDMNCAEWCNKRKYAGRSIDNVKAVAGIKGSA